MRSSATEIPDLNVQNSTNMNNLKARIWWGHNGRKRLLMLQSFSINCHAIPWIIFPFWRLTLSFAILETIPWRSVDSVLIQRWVCWVLVLNGSFHGFHFTLLKWKATMRAIMEIGSQEADERLVLVVSDADLQRWDTRSAFGVQYLTWTCSCRCFSIVNSHV